MADPFEKAIEEMKGGGYQSFKEFFGLNSEFVQKFKEEVRGEKGPKGDSIPGPKGEKGDSIIGPQGPQGPEGKQGASGKDGKSIIGPQGPEGQPGLPGENGSDAEIDPEEVAITVIEYIKTLEGEIPAEAVSGLEILKEIPAIKKMAAENALPITTTFFFENGRPIGRAKNINLVGGTVVIRGDTAIITPTGGSSVSAKLTPAETPKADGSIRTFTWSTPPSIIFNDGGPMQKVSTDGTVNWTGTTTTVLTVGPTFDIFGL